MQVGLQPLRIGLPWRLLWLSLGVGLGGYHLAEALMDGQTGAMLRGAGLSLLGLVWFLAPLHPIRPIKSETLVGSIPAIGSPALRLVMLTLGIALIVGGWLVG